MTNKENSKRAAMRALVRARNIRTAIEQSDRVYRAAPGDSVDDVLVRLRANHAVRTAALGEVSL